ncbi:hypothetical protein J6590_033902 [Homalodisca vitripennis]|nr:hypothetical protein J6590_033902 [Homalodisca vitripennis]
MARRLSENIKDLPHKMRDSLPRRMSDAVKDFHLPENVNKMPRRVSDAVKNLPGKVKEVAVKMRHPRMRDVDVFVTQIPYNTLTPPHSSE